VLHAFIATNVANELWNSNMNSGRDAMPSYAKFVSPVIANGKVFVATSNGGVVVYGLLQ
jgi:outer membrane protein assembly factor BamB